MKIIISWCPRACLLNGLVQFGFPRITRGTFLFSESGFKTWKVVTQQKCCAEVSLWCRLNSCYDLTDASDVDDHACVNFPFLKYLILCQVLIFPDRTRQCLLLKRYKRFIAKWVFHSVTVFSHVSSQDCFFKFPPTCWSTSLPVEEYSHEYRSNSS